MKQSHIGLRAAIRGLASRSEGMGLYDDHGFSPRQIINNARWLVGLGELIVVGYRVERRYFSFEEDAKRYETVTLPAIKAEKKAKRLEESLPRLRACRKPAEPKPPKVAKPKPLPKPKPHQAPFFPVKKEALPAPVSLKAPKVKWADQTPRITSQTKVTICPSPAHFGPAAKLAYAKPAQLQPLKAGKDI